MLSCFGGEFDRLLNGDGVRAHRPRDARAVMSRPVNDHDPAQLDLDSAIICADDTLFIPSDAHRLIVYGTCLANYAEC